MVADSMVTTEPDLNGSPNNKHLNFKHSRLTNSLRLPRLTQTVVPTVFTYKSNQNHRVHLTNGTTPERGSKLNSSDSALLYANNKTAAQQLSWSFEEKVPNESAEKSAFCLKTSSGNDSPPYLKAEEKGSKVTGSSPVRSSKRFAAAKLFGVSEVKVHGRSFGFSRLCSGENDECLRNDSPETKSDRTPAQVKSNQKSPEIRSYRKSPEVKSALRSPEIQVRRRSSEVKSVPRSPEIKSPARSPEVKSVPRSPEVKSVLRSPEVKSVLRSPEVKSVLRSPEVKSGLRSPEVKSVLRSPEVKSTPRSPEVKSGRKSPIGGPNSTETSVGHAAAPRQPMIGGFSPGDFNKKKSEVSYDRKDGKTPVLESCRSQGKSEKLPEGVELTLSELEEMACRQQHQIEAQRQLLAAKEQRLRFLKQHEARHQQVAHEHERLRRLRDRVEAQELKLKKLRALRGQVDHTKLNNASLTSDLKSIRALFNEKEKELSMAVAKVEELTLQLEDLKKGRGTIPSPPSAAAIELDKLRRELMYRNKLNEQQSVRLTQQREALALRQEEVSAVDRRISELQDRLQRKRLSNQQLAEQLQNAGTKPNDQVRNTLSSSALQHHQLKYQDQMSSCPSVPLYRSTLLQKQSSSDRLGEPMNQVPSNKSSDKDSDFLKKVNNNNNNNSSNNNIINNNNIYQLSNSVNQRKLSHDDFQTNNSHSKSALSEITSTKLISNYNVNSNQNKCPINDHIANNNLINRTGLTNVEPKLSPNSNDRLSEFSVSKSDPKYQTLPYNTKFTLDYNSSTQKFSSSVRKPGEGNESVMTENMEKNQGQNIHSVHTSSNKAQSSAVLNQNQSKIPPPPLPPPSSASPASSSSSSSSVNLAPRVYSLSGPMASSLLTRGQPVGGASSTTSSTTSLATTSSSAGSSTNNNQQKPVSTVIPTSIQQMTSPIYQTSSTKVHPVQPQTLSSTPQGILRDLKLGSPQNSSTPNSTPDSVHNKPALPPKPALPGKPTPPPPPRQSALWTTYQENAENQRLFSEQMNESCRLTQLEFLDINNRLTEKRPKPVVDTSSEAVDTALNVLRGSVNFSSRGSSVTDQNNAKNKSESQSESNLPLPPPPPADQSTEDRRMDKQLIKPWPSIGKKQSSEQNHNKNENSADCSPDSTNSEVMNVHVSLNRRIEMPPAFFFPENATPPADLVASVNQESYDKVDHSIPKHNCDDILSNKLRSEIKENGSAGSDTSQENAFSSETSNESQESKVISRIKKGNLKGNGTTNGLKRRVSFDPLALLLDASLEGELELVMKTATQVKDPSAANDEGITALHNAICAGHIDIVRFLVQFGCDVNAQDSDGWTPLHCAASCNNVAMVRFLVEHGACIFAQTLSDHETAAEKCEEDEEGFDGCSEFLYSVQEKLGILNNGAVYAVFDYEAHNADELSFREGDRLIVLRKGDECEKEWWWSRLNDREGYIPRNLLGLYPRVRPNKAAE
nr:PREDICTED: apoptosis-stimulating of p53 protein 1 isoform X2 [Bemisia tabaci]